jgi:hypothetical protein
MQSTDPEKLSMSEDSSQPLDTIPTVSPPVGKEASDDGAPGADDYLHGKQLFAIVISLVLGMFLIALDNVSPTLRSNPHADRRLLLDHHQHGYP